MSEEAPLQGRRCPYCGSDKLRREPAGSLRHPEEVFIVIRCETCKRASNEER